MTTAAQVITQARSHLGYKESPAGSNETMFGAWYGLNGEPWCAMFVSYVFSHAGHPLSISTSKGYSYCPAAVSWAKARGLWSNSGRYAPGDIIFFDWVGYGVAEHTGIVVSDDGVTVHTIEGNTSISGSQSNGGEVCAQSRPHGRTILGVLKASKLLTAPAPAPAWTKDGFNHPSLKRGATGGPVKHCQHLLLKHGANIVIDGTYGKFTEAAVRAFQKHHGLTVDGVVGTHTWGALHR